MPAPNSPHRIVISIKNPWNSSESETRLWGPKGSDTEPASKINRNCCILRESLAVWLRYLLYWQGMQIGAPRICTFIFKALCKHQPLHLHTIAAREVSMYSSSILCFLEVQRSTGHFYRHSLCSCTKGGFWQPLPSWANEFPKATQGTGGRTGITREILLSSLVLSPPCLPCNTPKQLAEFQLYVALL